MELPYVEEIMIVGRTMWTQSTSVTDRRTDGHYYLAQRRAEITLGPKVSSFYEHMWQLTII